MKRDGISAKSIDNKKIVFALWIPLQRTTGIAINDIDLSLGIF